MPDPVGRLLPATMALLAGTLAFPVLFLGPGGKVWGHNATLRGLLGAEIEEGELSVAWLLSLPVQEAAEEGDWRVEILRTSAPLWLHERLDRVAREVPITRAQRAVLGWLVLGHSNKEIATRLGCSIKTVGVHVSALLLRTGLASRSQLMAAFWLPDLPPALSALPPRSPLARASLAAGPLPGADGGEDPPPASPLD